MTNKFILKSMTIWGALIMFLPAVLPSFGIDFTADHATFVSEVGDKIIAFVGFIITSIGRWRAGGVKLL